MAEPIQALTTRAISNDDIPIGGGAKQKEILDEGEEKPLSRGAYNLDNLEELEKQFAMK